MNLLIHNYTRYFMMMVTFLCAPINLSAQYGVEEEIKAEKDVIIKAAREIMDDARYCALITLNHSGEPHVRMMDPFMPDENMIIWMGTNPKSRKVTEIQEHPSVTLYYADPKGTGYVTITGEAKLIYDPEEKAKRWKDGWEMFYKDKDESYLLISVVPEKLEILSFRHAIFGDSITWQIPSIELNDTAEDK